MRSVLLQALSAHGTRIYESHCVIIAPLGKSVKAGVRSTVLESNAVNAPIWMMKYGTINVVPTAKNSPESPDSAG